MKTNLSNEKLKRRYLQWLHGARGLAEPTLTAIERELSRWEEYISFEDLGKLTTTRAVGFKRHLEELGGNGKPPTANTRHHCLARLRAFFQWLSAQPGYKKRITAEAISYLVLDKKTVQSLNMPGLTKSPSLDHVKRLVESIEIKMEIDRRDRALIAFLLLSGMRDKAVATLPLGCFDIDTLEIRQFPREGVDTKFGKSFVTRLIVFDKRLLECVMDWFHYLVEVKSFDSTDPLFPRTNVAQADGGFTFESKGVEAAFWQGTGGIRQILKLRSETAGLPYYIPHSFRHAHIQLAMRHCRTAEAMKAVSQNIGHDHIGTTLRSYGTLDQFRVGEVIDSIDFGDNPESPVSQQEVDIIEKLVKRYKKGT